MSRIMKVALLISGLSLLACGGSTTTTGGASGGASGGGAAAGHAGAAGGGVGGAGHAGTGAGGAGAGGGGAGGAGHGGAGAGGGGAGGAGHGGAGAGGGGAGGAAGCADDCESQGFACCNGMCVNTHNDILNCGKCGTACKGLYPYCDNGKCGAPPCESGHVCADPGSCCGSTCCKQGEICCEVPGPVSKPAQCQKPNAQGTCDKGCLNCMCASPDTPIATPEGDRAIADLRTGDLVYSIDHGSLRVVPIVQVNRTRVHHHHVMRVRLVSGITLMVSPLHPTAGGETFGDLEAGGLLGGVGVKDVTLVAYHHDYTYDILPDSDTGTYIAGGALIGSTLASEAQRQVCVQPQPVQ